MSRPDCSSTTRRRQAPTRPSPADDERAAELFRRLVQARKDHDIATGLQLRRALRDTGWLVSPCPARLEKGGRA